MRMQIIGMVLAVAQTVVPVPRKTPKNQTGQSTQSKQSTKTDKQKSTAPATATVRPASPVSDGSSNPTSQCNACKPIIVSEPAPVSRKDGWDRAYVIATILLVGIGGFGIYYARRSLRAIESQLTKMGEQKTEMHDQVEA